MRPVESWELRYYRDRAGRLPFDDWLASLRSKDAVASVTDRLARLKRGLFGDCKPLGEGVLEFRIDLGPGYRGYFARSGRTVVLLLCGGDKRTQDRDIARAKDYWRDHEERIRFTRGPG
jgi:putative addiction module killer protein